MLRRMSELLIVLLLQSPVAFGQDVVPVGAGSYASTPPANAGDGAADMMRRTFSLVGSAARPIPTNKLWTHLLNGKAEGSLWMYPWRVDPRETGLELFLPLRWNDTGSDPVAESPLKVEAKNFRAQRLLVKDWGDWTLSFRLASDAERFIDVTVGEGMPTVWLEPHGVDLVIKGSSDARALGSDGKPLTFPSSARQFLINMSGRQFGVFLPQNSKIINEGDALRIVFSGKRFAAICALTKAADFKLAAESAYAIPRDSRFDWTFDPEKSQVRTVWNVRTEPLEPTQADVVWQGWLPHQWRGARHQLKLDGPEFLSPRGPLKTGVGNQFELTYDFPGILPFLPAPQAAAGPHPYSRERMEELLKHRADQPKYGDDSYWGGKDLLQFTQYFHSAQQLSSPTAGKLRESAYRSLTDWLTYTPGENAHYFAYYPNWKSLIGFKDSYDSARFNDQHFHYGYLTYSAALLGIEDPKFLQDYAPMLKLVARQYANWDRKDERFPFLRTFDPWAGHSWAGGLGSSGGNNQESTSEAMQSWIGLFLLGTMLNDAEMTAAGAMGYCLEERATMEYWFNDHGDLLPKECKHPLVGVLWSGGNVFGTYFSGDPAWVYAIQCLPQSPGLDYLNRRPEWARQLYRTIMSLRKAKEGSDDLGTMGDLGNCLLAQLSLIDPPAAAAEFDRLWDANNDIVRKSLDAARIYYHIHSYRALGARNWDVKLNVPTGAVYTNSDTGVTTYVVFNPQPYPVIVKAARAGQALGSFIAGPRRLTSTTSLMTSSKPGLAGTSPAAGSSNAPRNIETLYAVYDAPQAASAVDQARLEGKNAPPLSSSLLNEGRVLMSRISQPLTPGESYRWILPDGQSTQFTLEPQPPIAIVSSDPSHGQERIPNDGRIRVTFNAPISAESAQKVRLDGKQSPSLKAESSDLGATWTFAPQGELQTDETYTLIVPSGIISVFGDKLASEARISFVTAPQSCPPNIYRESMSGKGHWSSNLEIDFGNTEAPHTGKRAIKLKAGREEGAIALFNGPGNQGNDRQPVDLSKYRQVEYWIKGDCDAVWVKIGHPVFDKNAFNQTHQKGITSKYQRFTLDIPNPKDQINTVFEIAIPKNSTVYIDDIQFIGGEERPKSNSKKKK